MAGAASPSPPGSTRVACGRSLGQAQANKRARTGQGATCELWLLLLLLPGWQHSTPKREGGPAGQLRADKFRELPLRSFVNGYSHTRLRWPFFGGHVEQIY